MKCKEINGEQQQTTTTAAYIQEEQQILGHLAICGLGKSPGNGGCKQKLHNGFSMQVVIARNAGILTFSKLCTSKLLLA